MTMNTTATPRFPGDVIDHLADITPGSALDRVRRHRTEARTQAQQSFAALFTPAEPVPGTVSLRERLALAAFTAGLHGEPRSAVFYTRALATEDAELAAVVASEVVRGRAQSLQAGSGPHGPYGSYPRSEEHTSELQSQSNLVCRLLLEKKKTTQIQAQSNIVCSLMLEKQNRYPTVPPRTLTQSPRTRPHASYARDARSL